MLEMWDEVFSSMIDQIKEDYFYKFDSANSEEDKLYSARTLIIQYAHKIRELVNEVNALKRKTEILK